MKFDQKISCLIPCFNEEKNISRVLEIVTESKLFEEIIVVDDGSTDCTPEIVKKFKVKLIALKTNLGKGAAMATAIREANFDLLVFLDADLVGLKEEHLLKIVSPIAFTKEADLVLGVFAIKKLDENLNTKIANRTFPAITGQRAIWRKNLPDLDRLEKSRYGADYIISKNIPRKRRKIIKLVGLSQITKENKLDFPEAIKARTRMYREIIKAMGD
jgi:glycosyltransferase involved in cell wall biosynthesis